jgi:hypothetical protein
MIEKREKILFKNISFQIQSLNSIIKNNTVQINKEIIGLKEKYNIRFENYMKNDYDLYTTHHTAKNYEFIIDLF